MILRHYSATPFVFDPARTYGSDPYKPRGLWLSVVGEDDWKDWCESEEFYRDRLVHETDFALTPHADILHLSSVVTLRSFTRQFQMPLVENYYVIDWKSVATVYDGIIIAPYQWECRLDYETNWYYAWDCASACVWNLDAIEQVQVTA